MHSHTKKTPTDHEAGGQRAHDRAEGDLILLIVWLALCASVWAGLW